MKKNTDESTILELINKKQEAELLNFLDKIKEYALNQERDFEYLFEMQIQPEALTALKSPLIEEIKLKKHYAFASVYKIKLKGF